MSLSVCVCVMLFKRISNQKKASPHLAMVEGTSWQAKFVNLNANHPFKTLQ